MRLYICLVAGEASCVTHIVCGVMQSGCLNVTGQGDNTQAQNDGEYGWQKTKTSSRSIQCFSRHFVSPYRHTRRHQLRSTWPVS